MRSLFLSLFLAAGAVGCHSGKTPQLTVLGVHEAPASHVFVQVTNPASRPMRLTKLEYEFASAQSGATVSEGEVALQREIPAGAAVVVEVPLDAEADETLTMRGRIVAEADQIVRIFKVSAQIQPH